MERVIASTGRQGGTSPVERLTEGPKSKRFVPSRRRAGAEGTGFERGAQRGQFFLSKVFGSGWNDLDAQEE